MVIVDVNGVLLTANMEEGVFMILHGYLADMMSRVNPIIYWMYVTLENIHLAQCVKLQKALYRYLKIIFLFYQKLVADLES